MQQISSLLNLVLIAEPSFYMKTTATWTGYVIACMHTSHFAKWKRVGGIWKSARLSLSKKNNKWNAIKAARAVLKGSRGYAIRRPVSRPPILAWPALTVRISETRLPSMNEIINCRQSCCFPLPIFGRWGDFLPAALSWHSLSCYCSVVLFQADRSPFFISRSLAKTKHGDDVLTMSVIQHFLALSKVKLPFFQYSKSQDHI